MQRTYNYGSFDDTHLNVLKFMLEYYYKDIIDIINKIIGNVTEKDIDNILRGYTGLMSQKRIILIKKFLIGKVSLLQEQFEMRKEE